ncbi:MAG: PQQ-dependent sugar dehydrogenase [Candidatus Kariarchaeaceae archaeon]
MTKKRVFVIFIVILIIAGIIIIPYLPLYFGDLGTVIKDHDLEPTFENIKFSDPVDFQYVEINDSGQIINRIFVVEQRGVIIEVKNYNSNTPVKSDFLDIQTKVSSGGEKGLLGLTFHPNYSENGYLFVDYTASSPLRTVISRFTVENPLNGTPEITSEKIILEVNQPYSNHNAGQIMFGLDGYLYITMGDGGSANDPDENGQNKSTLLGSILRIDVDVTENVPYQIPADNPFLGNTQGYREEIYAYGFRNPWRMSQDSTSGYIYVGDVGQNEKEEINVIIPDGSEKNYGWDKKEGTNCFFAINCDGDYIDPIVQYSHSEGISVTGGYVYYGDTLDDLNGYYIYGDYWSGKVWALKYDGTKLLDDKFVLQYEIKISTFGINWNGDILVIDYNGGIVYTLINAE